jgi:integrase
MKGRRRLVWLTPGVPKARRKVKKSVSFHDFAPEYMRRWAKVRKKTWDDDRNAIKKYLLPAFGYRPIHEIRKNEVWELIDSVAARYPAAANRLKSTLSRMFKVAVDWGYLQEGHPNPTIGIPPYPETKRDRFLQPEEIVRLKESLAECSDPWLKRFFWLLLLTGLRKSELLTLKWTNISWERKEIKIEKTKAGRTHYLPLTTAIANEFHLVPRLEHNPYVFPGIDNKTGLPSPRAVHRANVNNAWKAIKLRAGLNDVRIHDLRRTTASLLAQSGASLHLIGRLLNQTSPSTTAIYARFQQSDVRSALETLSNLLESEDENLSA